MMDDKDAGTAISQSKNSSITIYVWGFVALLRSLDVNRSFDSWLVFGCLLFVTIIILAVSKIFASSKFIIMWVLVLYSWKFLKVLYKDSIGANTITPGDRVFNIVFLAFMVLVLLGYAVDIFKVIKRRKDISS